MAVKDHHLALRLTAHDLQQIANNAADHKLSRTEYMTRAALGRLNAVGLEDEIQRLKQRLDRLEALQYGE